MNYFQDFEKQKRENARKQEKTGVCDWNSKNLKKISKKWVDNYRHIAYNKRACLAGVYSACIWEKEVSCMAAAGVRVKITLACTECKQRNYNTMKNKRNNPDRIEMSKYCRFCKKHTAHKETR